MLIRKYASRAQGWTVDPVAIESLLSYVNRDADRKVVLDAIVERYARAIVTPKDLLKTPDGEPTALAHVRAAAETAIREGLYEVVMLRWLSRMATETATLYTEPGSTFVYTTETGKEDEHTRDVIESYRSRSEFATTMPVVDAYSFEVGSAGVYVSWEGRRTRYQPVPISRTFPRFGYEVTDDDESRAVNCLSIDDALSWTIAIDGAVAESGNKAFVSWFGASDVYPRGRVCTWEGADITKEPPPPGPTVKDYTEKGFVINAPAESLANPLTLAAQASMSEWDHPEYPIALFYDDALAQSDRLLRTTGMSRFDLSKEIDIAASRLTTSMLRSARGVFALSNPKGQPLPNGWDEGMIQLLRDQLLHVLSHPVDNATGGWEMLRDIMRAAAEADGVAGYLVAPDTGADLSGRAIIAATAPMVRRRNARIEINRQGQRRVFEIERAWLNTSGGESLDWTTTETWHPGEITIPGDDEAEERVSATQFADKAIDRVERVRRANKLTSRTDAEQLITTMEDGAKANPALGWTEAAKPQLQALSLADRVAQRRQGGAK